MKDLIYSVMKKEKEEVINLRRELHKRAEVSFEEFKTAEFVENYLKENEMSPKRIIDTGVLAFLDAGKEETILLRADMDALPIDEIDDSHFKSENEGVMHACGHDAHMAVLLCTAKILNEHKDKLNVNVLVLFQPGEETDGGAEPILNEGIIEKYNIKEALGLHVMNDVPAGRLMIKAGALMASPDDFEIKICGRGGHGSEPEKCIDPISVAATIIPELNSLTEKEIAKGEKQVIQVCTISGGTSCNVIPDAVEISGTARSFNEDIRKKIPALMEEIIKNECDKAGAKYEFKFNFRYPPLLNDENVAKKMQKVIEENIGDVVINWESPIMAGDDFAYFGNKVPSNYFYLGTGNEEKGITMPLHSAHFKIDEDALILGVLAYVSYVLSSF